MTVSLFSQSFGGRQDTFNAGDPKSSSDTSPQTCVQPTYFVRISEAGLGGFCNPRHLKFPVVLGYTLSFPARRSTMFWAISSQTSRRLADLPQGRGCAIEAWVLAREGLRTEGPAAFYVSSGCAHKKDIKAYAYMVKARSPDLSQIPHSHAIRAVNRKPRSPQTCGFRVLGVW